MGRKKKLKPGYCVYCGEWVEHPTREHAFPTALYDDPPPNSERLIVPVCKDCNSLKAKSDGEFRDAMIFGDRAWLHSDARQVMIGPHTRAVLDGKSRVAKSIDRARLGMWESPNGILVPNQLVADIDPGPVVDVVGHAALGLVYKVAGHVIIRSHTLHVREICKGEFLRSMDVIGDSDRAKWGIEGKHVVQWGLELQGPGEPRVTAYRSFMRFYRSRAFEVQIVPRIDLEVFAQSG